MLLLPYSDKSVVRSFPVVTTLLVVACTVVLFAFQSRDPLREQHAFEYYHESGLDKIELPLYEEYLASSNEADATERLRLLHRAEPGSLMAAQLLQGDAQFVRALHAKHILRESDADFADWSAARQHFDEMLNATVPGRFALERYEASEFWRFVTYSFLHGGVAHWLGNMVVLVLVGPFVESALGRLRFAAAYLAGGAAAGALHVIVSDSAVIGASGAIAATIGMLAVLYGTRKVPVFYWVFIVFGTAQIPALALLPIWLINEGYQWSLQARGPLSDATVAYAAHVGGLCAGAILARLWRPRAGAGAAMASPAASEQRRMDAGSTLAAQAQDAAARLDIRRATRLYRELVELEPKRVEYLGAYLNVALLGAEEDILQDAALRLLWARVRTPTDDLRKTFLQLTQPKILKVLPIDEHLRLARRLVRFREDAAALRVIDALLRDDHLRQLYGRQLADCLLGLFTAYTRNGLLKQVEQVNARLTAYFPTTDQRGGMAPTKRAPTTLLTSVRPTSGGLSLPVRDPQLASTTRSTKYDG